MDEEGKIIMDVKDFVKEYTRMCETYVDCLQCPLQMHSDRYCFEQVYVNPEKVVGAVMAWSKEHPLQTKAEKFKEVFGVEVAKVGYQANHTLAYGLPADWWDAPYEEPKEDE